MARPGFWIDTIIGTDLVVTVTNAQSLMTDASLTQSRRGWTCVRTIIGIDIARVVHDSGEGSHNVGMGIGISSDAGFQASGGIPDLATATEFPTRGWLFRAQYRVWGFAADDPTIHTVRIEKDIRAKRKIDNGVMYAVWKSTANEGAVATLRVDGIIRQYWLDA